MSFRMHSALMGLLLFFSCIRGRENRFPIDPRVIAEIDTAAYTTIEWLDTVKSFGTVTAGKEVLLEFEFKNTGKTPLFILNVTPSCGCTVVGYPKKPVLPGKAGTLIGKFDSKGSSGRIVKSIRVSTNTKNQQRRLLYFFGEVKETM